jgi:Outer membrane lipoprotein-sorting protein
MQMKFVTALAAGLLAALLTAIPLKVSAEPDPTAILAAADLARGGGVPGVIWKLKITSNGVDEESGQNVQELTVKAIPDSSLAAVMYPPRRSGSKLLQVSRNMWFSRPDLRVSISQRQKMSGQAANGDVASTNYVSDYTATPVREESIDGEDCYVLDLSGKHNWVTYDRILYWVSKSRQVALQAEYYTVSGKLLKTATFEYANTIEYQGHPQIFISKLTIRDALNRSNYSVLEYSDVKLRAFAPSEFTVAGLME